MSALVSAPSEWDGQIVSVLGVLENGRGLWTEIDCPCCSEQLDARVELHDTLRPGALVLRGTALTSQWQQTLTCRARDSRMIESVAAATSPQAFVFENDAGLLRDTAAPLPPTYCCSIEVRHQLVVATGTVYKPTEELAPTVLRDPTLCELLTPGAAGKGPPKTPALRPR